MVSGILISNKGSRYSSVISDVVYSRLVPSCLWIPLYYVRTSATCTYTSELTNNHRQQAMFNTYYFIVLYGSTLIFLGQVLVLNFSLQTDDVGTARKSQAINTFVTSSTLFGVAWKFLFRDCPVLSQLSEGSTLLKCGFQRIQRSSRMIRQDLPYG
jgi:hypothetical protein